MCSQIKLNHQMWAVILLYIVLITAAVCGRSILEEPYEDTEPYNNQGVEQQKVYDAPTNKNILLQRLQLPLKRLIRAVTPPPPVEHPICRVKICPPLYRQSTTSKN